MFKRECNSCHVNFSSKLKPHSKKLYNATFESEGSLIINIARDIPVSKIPALKQGLKKFVKRRIRNNSRRSMITFDVNDSQDMEIIYSVFSGLIKTYVVNFDFTKSILKRKNLSTNLLMRVVKNFNGLYKVRRIILKVVDFSDIPRGFGFALSKSCREKQTRGVFLIESKKIKININYNPIFDVEFVELYCPTTSDGPDVRWVYRSLGDTFGCPRLTNQNGFDKTFYRLVDAFQFNMALSKIVTINYTLNTYYYSSTESDYRILMKEYNNLRFDIAFRLAKSDNRVISNRMITAHLMLNKFTMIPTGLNSRGVHPTTFKYWVTENYRGIRQTRGSIKLNLPDGFITLSVAQIHNMSNYVSSL